MQAQIEEEDIIAGFKWFDSHANDTPCAFGCIHREKDQKRKKEKVRKKFLGMQHLTYQSCISNIEILSLHCIVQVGGTTTSYEVYHQFLGYTHTPRPERLEFGLRSVSVMQRLCITLHEASFMGWKANQLMGWYRARLCVEKKELV